MYQLIIDGRQKEFDSFEEAAWEAMSALEIGRNMDNLLDQMERSHRVVLHNPDRIQAIIERV